MTACAKCGGPIRWARTEAGKAMPVDPDPDPDGNVAVHYDPQGHLRARVLRKGEQGSAAEQVTQSHFATCPANAPNNPPPVPAGTTSLARARDTRRRASYDRRYRR